MFNKKNDATMKKTYKNPTMVVVKIHTRQQMMTLSTNAAITGSQSNEDALGRGFDFDFDDEE